MSLKALADAVLERNRVRNQGATDPEKPRNKRPAETPVLLHDSLHAEAINADAIEFFEERAGIAEYDGGLSREEAEAQAREATERHRRECWERHQRNAERILSLPTWAAREQALERYRKEAVAQYGDKAGDSMGREMANWIRVRIGLTSS